MGGLGALLRAGGADRACPRNCVPWGRAGPRPWHVFKFRAPVFIRPPLGALSSAPTHAPTQS